MVYNLFIDSDIFLDVLLERRPFLENSFALFKAQYNSTIQIYTTAIIILNVQYSAAKLRGNKDAKIAIKQLLDFVKICNTDKQILSKAYSSSFADVEDAVQYYSAVADKNVDFFVTRNVSDYKRADEHLKVISPIQAIKILS